MVFGRRAFHLLGLIFFLFGSSYAQNMGVLRHDENGNYAITKDDITITDFIFSEVGAFSEGKAIVAQDSSLYAYIDTNGQLLTPYAFTVAGAFKDGYAVVGDSFSQGLINEKMHIVVPIRYYRVLLPKLGLVRVQTKLGYWGAYDLQGKQRLPFIYDIPPIYQDLHYIIVRKDLEYGVVDEHHTILYNTSYQYIGLDGIGYRSGIGLRLFTPSYAINPF